MTITRVTDDPGITSTHALRCGKKHSWCGRRWLVWALLVEIPLDARGKTKHHGHPHGVIGA